MKSSGSAADDDDDPGTDTSFPNGVGGGILLLCHRRFPSSWDSLKCSCNRNRTNRRNDSIQQDHKTATKYNASTSFH